MSEITADPGSKYKGLAIALLIALAIFIFNFSPIYFVKGIGHNDAAHYFAHAQTLAMDLDLDYSNQSYVATWYNDGTTPTQAAGAGFMASPFMFLGVQIDRALGHPIVNDNGAAAFSWSKFAFALATVVYFFCACALMFAAGRLIWPQFPLAVAVLGWLSSGVLFYVLQQSISYMSYFVFSLALCLYAGVLIWRDMTEGRRRLWPLLLGVLAVDIVILTRPENWHVFLLPFVIPLCLHLRNSIDTEQIIARRVMARRFACLAGLLLIAFLPLSAYYNQFYGTPFPTYGLFSAKTALPGKEDAYGGGGTMQAFGMKGQVSESDNTPASEVNSHEEDKSQLGDMVVAIMGKLKTAVLRFPNLLSIFFGWEYGLLWCHPALFLGTLYLLFSLLRAWLRKFSFISSLELLICLGTISFPFVIQTAFAQTGSMYGWRILAGWWPLAWLGFIWLVQDWYGWSKAPAGRFKPFLRYAFILLVGFASLGPVFYQANEVLAKRPGRNAFGKLDPLITPNFVPDLFCTIISPYEWMHMPGHRYPGFIFHSLIRIPAIREKAPARIVSFDRKHFADVPLYVDLQVLLLALAWIACALLLYRFAESYHPEGYEQQ